MDSLIPIFLGVAILGATLGSSTRFLGFLARVGGPRAPAGPVGGDDQTGDLERPVVDGTLGEGAVEPGTAAGGACRASQPQPEASC